MGYSPPALHYGQLAVAAPRSVTQTFRVKPNPHATSAAATTQSMKQQITLLESWLQLWSHHKLHHHCLLNSPLRSTPESSSSSATAARQAPPSTSPLGSTKKQPIEDYNQFALLVSSTYDPNQTVQLPETPEEKTGSYKEQRAAKIDHQSSSISPSTSALSSGGDSSGSSSPGLARSSSFYRRLLYSFDKTLTQLVLSHHHQSFPSLLVSPSEAPALIHPRPRPPSPSSSPSAPAQRRQAPRPLEPDKHNPLFPPDLDGPICPTLKRKSILKPTTTLDHHGFVFNIQLNHLPSILHPHLPSDHIRLIEDHVLSNFVYSVKTRG
ncbi:uncharacterized protein PGTG_14156 [Puccinia graminis f. sp. tritici CRL 75-36-700-3]|uniref:Uncharacterized protein n=1 Tax=Puccinia graminis f. sp. tritici (strain CRL 75-36-700-3 / race SCCL) TaxID=418459 RepID=E3KX47_PUCGT|nr:uncharacterized protein PGTG_14156 [Puccinia graminis f. sp. tritici CRL 75-36-700-3]EFP88817.1 hypothetical protein PGTG_14156 [Puccinia graminis f. sp. tritici CRL 75-36-700-3]